MIIYRTTNLINGKTYIGLDTRNCPSYFGSGTYLKSAIKKYGKSNFCKEIVEQGFKSMEDLFKAEKKYIALERKNNFNGIYNLCDGGRLGLDFTGKTWEELVGIERASIIKNKISETNKIKGVKPPSRIGANGSDKQREAVIQTNKTRQRSKEEIGQLIARTIRPIMCLQNNLVYSSLKEAAEKLNLSKGNICSVLKGNRPHTKGFTFVYRIGS